MNFFKVQGYELLQGTRAWTPSRYKGMDSFKVQGHGLLHNTRVWTPSRYKGMDSLKEGLLTEND